MSVSREDCEGQSLNETKKSLERRIRQPPRRPRGDGKKYPRRTHRYSKLIEWIKSEKE
jgi:hypothetical protein